MDFVTAGQSWASCFPACCSRIFNRQILESHLTLPESTGIFPNMLIPWKGKTSILPPSMQLCIPGFHLLFISQYFIHLIYLTLCFTEPLSKSLQFQAHSKHSGVWDWGLWGHQGYVMTAQVRGLTLEGSPSLSARGPRHIRKHGRWKSECWE